MKSLPWTLITALVLLCAGAALAVSGVYVLAGQGWALLTAAPLCVGAAALILRGLDR